MKLSSEISKRLSAHIKKRVTELGAASVLEHILPTLLAEAEAAAQAVIDEAEIEAEVKAGKVIDRVDSVRVSRLFAAYMVGHPKTKAGQVTPSIYCEKASGKSSGVQGVAPSS